ncbi:MAG: hypothetical protein M1823_000531 [Watsoniomyces obsoletus]|nr:MAG: hypothetical protein M1823_000531 [Watsoniomyces obsoletus]
MATVIIGAGIIGVSTAYCLSQSSRTSATSILLIESSPRLFASGSGYAAGFLAKDWFSAATAPLGALSFALHKELAERYNGREKWGYSPSTATSLQALRSSTLQDEDWLSEGASRSQLAVDKQDTDSGDVPGWLIPQKGQQCLERGVQLHHPVTVVSVAKDMRDELAAVRIMAENGLETDLPCSRLVFTAGPWTSQVFSSLFPSATVRVPVTSLAGHSLVVRCHRWSAEDEARGCHAVFATDPSSGFSPEIFSRIGGEIYIAGLNSSTIPLPVLATDAIIDESVIRKLREVATQLLGLPGDEKDLDIVRQGLCYRPITPNGRPIISRVPDQKLGDDLSTRADEGGVFICAGHGPWGISLSLGTGKVMADLIEGKQSSMDLAPFRL